MHNGIFSTLEEVIAFVDRGGGEGNTELKPLGLTAEEKQALRTFLVEGLTGPEIVDRLPAHPLTGADAWAHRIGVCAAGRRRPACSGVCYYEHVAFGERRRTSGGKEEVIA